MILPLKGGLSITLEGRQLFSTMPQEGAWTFRAEVWPPGWLGGIAHTCKSSQPEHDLEVPRDTLDNHLLLVSR